MSDNNEFWKKLLGAAQVVVGGALVVQGFKRATGGAPQPLFGAPGSGRAALTEGGSIRTAVAAEIPGHDLDARIEKINDVFQRSAPDPQIREDLAWILTAKCGQSWCLPVGTLVLKRGADFVPVEQLRPGDEIVGDGDWTKVKSVWDSGIKPVLSFTLNNGSTLRCTAEHKVFVVRRRWQTGKVAALHKRAGSLPGRREDVVEIPAGEVQIGDDLLQPESAPFGATHYNDDEALILGAYVADGWLEPSRASIAGIPGNKGVREQVIEAATRLGLPFSVDSHKVRLNSRMMVEWLSGCGDRAGVKRLPTMDLDKSSVEAVLRGLNADAWVKDRGTDHEGTPHFTTTSSLLAMQYRMLQRMLGRSASMHVNLSKHPGHAPVISVKVREVTQGRGAKVWAQVTAIQTDAPEPTFDIETESQRIYLPESDVVVHNCVPPKNQMAEVQAIFTAVTDPRSPLAIRYTSDHLIYDQFQSYRATRRLKIGDCDDQVIYGGELLVMAGFPIKFRVVQTKSSQTPNHIYLVVGMPKEDPAKWIPFDPTEPQNKLGWQVAGAEQAALSGRASGEVAQVWDYDVMGLGI